MDIGNLIVHRKKDVLGNMIFFVVSICFSIYIYARYLDWGIENFFLYPFLVLIDSVFLFFAISVSHYKRILNPCSIYLLFIGLFAYSTLPISDNFAFQNKLFAIVLFGILSYLIGLLIPTKLKLNVYGVFSKRSKRLFYYFLVFLSSFSFLHEVRSMGYIPILALGKSIDIYGDAGEAMSFLHTFVLLAPILIFWTLILARKNILSTKERKIFLLLLSLIFVNNFGRTSLLMFAITGLIYFDFYFKISIPKLLIGVASFVFVFILMGNIRSGNTTETINVILRNIAKTKYETSILESYLVSYSSVNFYKMNDVIKKKEELGYASYGKNAIKPIVKLLKMENTSIAEFQTQQNLSTYMADPYIDFGIWGVVVFNLLYAFTATCLFRKYKEGIYDEYIISWGLIVFCMFMTCFFNAFNTMLVWIVYVCNKILLKE